MTLSQCARSLSDFAGLWRLEREIVHDDGTLAQFSGTAQWMPEGDRLRCVEAGTMRIGSSPPMSGQRVYFWDADLWVYFDDGRPFHRVPPTGGDTGHWCDPDQYDGNYDFSQWPAFTVTWSVRGPRKAYRMVSRYSLA
ncbi:MULTISPECIES: DUF6314 family protein [Roseobacteraceae]|jgi:hypothetical protein|uniref:Trigger factor n=1 Tax=Pseudosulfitobacter pseudonitzschiae TaxID=1402135 RepID=A0A221JYS3_9RHOB|nr:MULTISPECIES: DUF6314 family protein [Roseobacteraceae]ASM71884.1 trigger factor [Pseudosulfitobacter pseudonitzschiae]